MVVLPSRGLDLEDLLDVSDTKSLLERSDGAVSHALDIGVDSLDGDTLLDEGNALADGLDNLGRKTTLDEADELLGEGLAESGFDLYLSADVKSVRVCHTLTREEPRTVSSFCSIASAPRPPST